MRLHLYHESIEEVCVCVCVCVCVRVCVVVCVRVCVVCAHTRVYADVTMHAVAMNMHMLNPKP
jgi:hypothetical protein